ncbi:MAG: hypothetical protein HY598_02915 [Candidatus Omnitrophica bacterium]|nr:hypothetical protein [Candidatus Omnitrophota bacterium]
MSVLVGATVVAWGMALWRLIGLVRGPGLIGRLRRLFGMVFWAGLGLLLGAVLILRQCFLAFSGETLVARVTAQRLAPQRVELRYRPMAPERPEVRMELQGDQWAVSGGIVKWHPALALLGIKSYHRPMRLSGQFSDLQQQRTHLPTVYALQPHLVDRYWEGMYWVGRYLPWVEAVYGSSAYAYVEPGRVQEIYITPSGYIIKVQPGPL